MSFDNAKNHNSSNASDIHTPHGSNTPVIYDFIICGGGTAGLTVANRLSKNPAIKVLVLEAGKSHISDFRVNVPNAWRALLESEADWNFETVPQKALDNRIFKICQGRALGGSSVINSTSFTTPPRVDIDVWESLGNFDMNWTSLKPYIDKFHTLHKPLSQAYSDYSRTLHAYPDQSLGPVQVSSPYSGEFAALCTIDPATGERSDAVTAYYEPTLYQLNLKVFAEASACRICLGSDSLTPIAIGVEFIHKGVHKMVYASKDVILAAGCLNTPQILELSGIGSPKILEPNNIPVLVANPNVGENLQDHLGCGISFEAADSFESYDDIARQEPKSVDAAIKEYERTRSGRLCKPFISTLEPTFNTFLSAQGGEKRLNELLKVYPQTTNEPIRHKFIRSILQTSEQTANASLSIAQQKYGANSLKELLGAELSGNYITLHTTLCRPFSTGHIHISCPNPQFAPCLDFRYLSHPLDMEILARHIQQISESSSEFPQSIIKLNGKTNTLYNGPFKSFDQAKDYVRKTAIPGNEPVGTCAMLPQDKGGVVDTSFRVYGVRGLRVVDASVIPVIPGNGLQSLIYAIAERASDVILNAMRNGEY